MRFTSLLKLVLLTSILGILAGSTKGVLNLIFVLLFILFALITGLLFFLSFEQHSSGGGPE